ncbi:MAG: Sec-independent protein translocase protein TatB [Pseudomonadota bacterium]|nr:Sec-independent protein translocase protein TatB [Pseudomonadota bacterium]
MFDFSFSELVLIGLIALIVLGPQRLPEVARALGRWMARLRRFLEDVKRDVDHHVQDDDLAAFRKIQEELAETRQALEHSAHETISGLNLHPESGNATAPEEAGAEAPDSSHPAVAEMPQVRRARKPAARKRPARKNPSPAKTGSPIQTGSRSTRNGNGSTRKTRPR